MAIIQANQIKTVIISARWVDLQRRGLEGLADTIATLNRLGVTTYVVGQSPMFTTDVQLIASRQQNRPGDDWAISMALWMFVSINRSPGYRPAMRRRP